MSNAENAQKPARWTWRLPDHQTMPNAFAAECVFVLAQQGQWGITMVSVVPKSEMLLPLVRKQQHSAGARRCSAPSVFVQEKTEKPQTTMLALVCERFNTDQLLQIANGTD